MELQEICTYNAAASLRCLPQSREKLIFFSFLRRMSIFPTSTDASSNPELVNDTPYWWRENRLVSARPMSEQSQGTLRSSLSQYFFSTYQIALEDLDFKEAKCQS